MEKMKRSQDVWVGIDWGEQEHSVSAVSERGETLAQFRVPNTPAGYRMLDERMARCGTVRGLAVETTRHPLVLHLREQGVMLYLINPKLSKAWRLTDTVSGAKSDDRDGLTLARGLAFRHAQLRPAVQGDPALERLALLCEKECHLIDRRTALVQELQSLLKVYYPAALRFFDDWTAPAAWDFLKRFPDARTLTRAQASTVIAFLKGHRLGYSKHWEDKVRTRGEAGDWPVHPQQAVYQMLVHAIVGQLHALMGALRQFRAEIATAFQALPQAAIVASLPGAGPKLAPRLTAIVGAPQVQSGEFMVLRTHTGVAPVTVQSGKRRVVRIRHTCNKTWRNTMHLFAWCSTRFSPWAQAFYRCRRTAGDTHSTALRKLGDKWLKIIRRILETRQPYSEDLYMSALQRSNSPLYQFIRQGYAGKPCGEPT